MCHSIASAQATPLRSGIAKRARSYACARAAGGLRFGRISPVLRLRRQRVLVVRAAGLRRGAWSGPHTRRIAEHSFFGTRGASLSYPQVFDSELCWLVLFTSLHALDEEEEAKRRFLLVPHYNKTFVTFATSTVEEQPDIAAELGVTVSNIPRVCE